MTSDILLHRVARNYRSQMSPFPGALTLEMLPGAPEMQIRRMLCFGKAIYTSYLQASDLPLIKQVIDYQASYL